MQLPPIGADGPYLIAAAAVYVAIEMTKFVHMKRNGAIPEMAEHLSKLSEKITISIAKTGEFNRNLIATLGRIEGKVEINKR